MTCKSRTGFLDKAIDCGATLTGKADGSEAVTVVFSPGAWQKFDAAMASLPAHLTDEQIISEIGTRIGFGRVQQIAGRIWEETYGCAPRGRMGVSIRGPHSRGQAIGRVHLDNADLYLVPFGRDADSQPAYHGQPVYLDPNDVITEARARLADA